MSPKIERIRKAEEKKEGEEEESQTAKIFASAVNDLSDVMERVYGEELTQQLLTKFRSKLIRALYWTERLRAEMYFKERKKER
jgi:hypothetical protein